jgi:hypothetical protein
MADFFSATALKGYTLHTERGFVIFNEGKETRLIPEASRALLEREGVIGDGGPLDRDGNGEAGGSKPQEPPALSGLNKTELLKVASDEGVTVEDGATNAKIVEAIEAKRSASGEAPTD